MNSDAFYHADTKTIYLRDVETQLRVHQPKLASMLNIPPNLIRFAKLSKSDLYKCITKLKKMKIQHFRQYRQ